MERSGASNGDPAGPSGPGVQATPSSATPEIQIGLGSIELDSGQHRPAPGCLVNRYNRVVLYVTK